VSYWKPGRVDLNWTASSISRMMCRHLSSSHIGVITWTPTGSPTEPATPLAVNCYTKQKQSHPMVSGQWLLAVQGGIFNFSPWRWSLFVWQAGIPGGSGLPLASPTQRQHKEGVERSVSHIIRIVSRERRSNYFGHVEGLAGGR
jgi:hypothetical protein